MIQYRIDGAKLLVLARMTGSNTLVDLMIHITNVARDADYRPSCNLLFEVAGDVTFVIMPAEREFETLIREWMEHRKGVKWAFWAPMGVAYSQVQYALETLGLKSPHAQLFQDEHTARNWLSGQSVESVAI